MVDAVVLPFRPRPDAPVQPFPADVFGEPETEPRPHFGLRQVDRVLDLFSERKGPDYVRRAAKAARDALDGKAPPALTRDAALLQEAAGRLNAGAAGWRDVAQFLESLGCIAEARAAYEHADDAETLSARILIPITPEIA